MSDPNRPVGPLVADPTPAPQPSRITLTGRSVTLEALQEWHADELFHHVGGVENGWIWDYMGSAPPTTMQTLRTLLASQAQSADPLFWAVRVPGQGVVGFLSLMRMAPAQRCLELGNILFSPILQRTTAATEAVYLLARYVFRDLGYRRLEWKCNDLNQPSKRAARRLGFTPEGVFRQHMIVKGRNRDTAWFSILDSEWHGDTGERGRRGLEAALEHWLDPGNFDAQGKQRKRLEHFRAAA
jgi:RimJ/RimL family protein N-acetyltransferase